MSCIIISVVQSGPAVGDRIVFGRR